MTTENGSTSSPSFQECPECKQNSLRWDEYYRLFECTNNKCKVIFNEKDLARKRGVYVETQPELNSNIPKTSPDVKSIESRAIKQKSYKNLFSRSTILITFTAVAVVSVVIYFVILPWLNTINSINPPKSFSVVPGNMKNTLSWKFGGNSDCVMIRCKTTGYPLSIEDGTQIYCGTGTRYTHNDLTYGAKYYYAIWSGKSTNGETIWSDTNKLAFGAPIWIGLNGENIHEYVEIEGARVVGADGNYIELFNNHEAENPSWAELRRFLFEDETDKVIYDESSFVCADFAEMLHNNAENEGIRAAYVTIDLVSSDIGHACNVFNTTDKEVNIVKNQEYKPTSIFNSLIVWESLGEVDDFWIQW